MRTTGHKALANTLRRAGFAVVASYRRTEDMNAGVELDYDYDVQIANGKFYLQHWTEKGKTKRLGSFTTVEALIEKLKSIPAARVDA